MAVESNDKATRLRDALQQICKLSLASDRAAALGVATACGTVAATVAASCIVPFLVGAVVAALGTSAAAKSLFSKLKDAESEKGLLEQSHFTEREKNFLKEFKEQIKGSPKESRNAVLEAYLQKVAEIVSPPPEDQPPEVVR